jgi:hypothetical protein
MAPNQEGSDHEYQAHKIEGAVELAANKQDNYHHCPLGLSRESLIFLSIALIINFGRLITVIRYVRNTRTKINLSASVH